MPKTTHGMWAFGTGVAIVGDVGCGPPPCGGRPVGSAVCIIMSIGVLGALTGAAVQRRVGAAGVGSPPANAIDVPPCGGESRAAASEGTDVGSFFGAMMREG